MKSIVVNFFLVVFSLTLLFCKKNQDGDSINPKDLLSPNWHFYLEAKNTDLDPVQEDSFQRNFVKAEKLFNEKKWQEAKDAIEKALTFKTTAHSYNLYGDILFQLSKFKDATKSYKLSEIAGNQNLGNLYLKIAQSEAQLNNPKEALTFLSLAQNEKMDVEKILKSEKIFQKVIEDKDYKENLAKIQEHVLLKNEERNEKFVQGHYSEKAIGDRKSTYLCEGGISLRKLSCRPGYEIFEWKMVNGSVVQKKIGRCMAQYDGRQISDKGVCPKYENFKLVPCEYFDSKKETWELSFSQKELNLAIKSHPPKPYNDIQFQPLKEKPKQCNKDFKPQSLDDLIFL